MTLAKAIAALTGREIVNNDTIVTVDADIPAEFSSSVAMLDVDIAVDIVDEITVMDAVIVICYEEPMYRSAMYCVWSTSFSMGRM